MTPQGVRRRLPVPLVPVLLLSLLSSVLPAVGATGTAWATQLGGTPGCSAASSPGGGLTTDAHPVVLVHGWGGTPMSKTRPLLEKKLPEGWQFRLFDYAADSTGWPAWSQIAGCLADYIQRLSDEHRKAGGDGLVYLVTHSMGGLAVRFAVDSDYGNRAGLADRIGGLVTLGTPHLGSPWANSGVYSGVMDRFHDQAIGLPPAGVPRASVCLAVHARGQGLPPGCDPAPLLPPQIPVHQVAGEATITRTFFGVRAYDLPLAGDSLVPTSSAHGYVLSGPSSPRGQAITTTSDVCGGDWTSLASQVASKAAAPAQALVGLAQMRVDGAALDAVLADQASPWLVELLLVANVRLPCGHTGLLTADEALTQVATALKDLAGKRDKPASQCRDDPAETAACLFFERVRSGQTSELTQSEQELVASIGTVPDGSIRIEGCTLVGDVTLECLVLFSSADVEALLVVGPVELDDDDGIVVPAEGTRYQVLDIGGG